MEIELNNRGSRRGGLFRKIAAATSLGAMAACGSPDSPPTPDVTPTAIVSTPSAPPSCIFEVIREQNNLVVQTEFFNVPDETRTLMTVAKIAVRANSPPAHYKVVQLVMSASTHVLLPTDISEAILTRTKFLDVAGAYGNFDPSEATADHVPNGAHLLLCMPATESLPVPSPVETA